MNVMLKMLNNVDSPLELPILDTSTVADNCQYYDDLNCTGQHTIATTKDATGTCTGTFW